MKPGVHRIQKRRYSGGLGKLHCFLGENELQLNRWKWEWEWERSRRRRLVSMAFLNLNDGTGGCSETKRRRLLPFQDSGGWRDGSWMP